MSDVVCCTNEVKRKCKYGSQDKSRHPFCDYLCIVGHSRGCSYKACEKFEKRVTKRGHKALTVKVGK